jgi:hypothetical protein
VPPPPPLAAAPPSHGLVAARAAAAAAAGGKCGEKGQKREEAETRTCWLLPLSMSFIKVGVISRKKQMNSTSIWLNFLFQLFWFVFLN